MDKRNPLSASFVLNNLPRFYAQLGENDPCNWNGAANREIYSIDVKPLGYPGKFHYLGEHVPSTRFLENRNEAKVFDLHDLYENLNEYESLWIFLVDDMAMKRTELGANCVLAVGLNDYDSADFKDRSGQVLTVLPGDLHYVTCVGWRYFDAMLEASGALQTNGDSEICDDTNSIVYEAILVKPDGTIQRGEQYHNHLEFWYQTGKMIDEGARYFVTQYTTPEDVYVKPERYIIWLLDKDYEITNNDVMEVSIK